MRATHLASVVLLLMLLATNAPLAGKTQSATADWPQWRGAHRDAISPAQGLVDRWPDEGPSVLWSSTAGAGFSGVSVANDRLYTLGDRGDAQFLICVDAHAGTELWRKRLGRSFSNGYGNGPRSTPLVDGKFVFAVGTQGHLVAAHSRTGEIVWEHDLVETLEAALPTYGFSSSPLILGDRLFLEVGGRNGTFAAFDKKTGKVAWSSQNDRPAYSSPIAVTLNGAEQVVFWSAGGLHALSPRDGSLLWKYAFETLCPATGDPLNTGTPIFIPPNRIFVAAGSEATLLEIESGEAGPQVTTVWRSRHMLSDVNSPVLVGEFLYGFHRDTLTCLDARTGKVRWSAPGFQRGSLIAADGKLIVLGQNGNLALIRATPDAFVQLDVASVLSGRNWTAPSLADGKLFLRNHDRLLAVDLEP